MAQIGIIILIYFMIHFSYGVIDDNDNRILLIPEQSDQHRMLAEPVAAIFNTGGADFKKQGDGTLLFNDDFEKKLCPDQKFARVPRDNRTHCSGFLISENLLMTAGHCTDVGPFKGKGNEEFCRNIRFVFGYSKGTRIGENDVYKCEKVLFSEHHGRDGNNIDLAIIRLNKPVTNRKPVTLVTDYVPSVGKKLIMVGQGMGLPIHATHGEIIFQDEKRDNFYSDYNSSDRNSGSPIFSWEPGNENQLNVVGVHVGGKPQGYKRRKGQDCWEADSVSIDELKARNKSDAKDVDRPLRFWGSMGENLRKTKKIIDKILREERPAVDESPPQVNQ